MQIDIVLISEFCRSENTKLNIMKYPSLYIVIVLILFSSCKKDSSDSIVQENFKFASEQLNYAFTEINQAIANESAESRTRREERNQGPLVSPRTINEDGTLQMVTSRDWTSGFFPGELWYMYEYTQDPIWQTHARKYTDALEREKDNGATHDMGFKVYCSFGNGWRLTGDPTYRDILLQSAYTLVSRYNPNVSAIRSWDHSKDKWQFPVIIDNMMNLELLFWAFRESNDSVFYNVAIDHAETTMKNHFRPDYSTYHVVDYDLETGEVLHRHTHQGYSHESTWSRGEAWAIYGYTLCYRESGRKEFLEQAKNVANFIFTHPNLPEDLIPYWDYNAPRIPNEPRDVSAATVTASALYEMSLYIPEQSQQYKTWADKIVENLSNDNYRAQVGENRGFLLMHSSGSGTVEIDKPLVYADYYFLEALLRKQKLGSHQDLF